MNASIRLAALAVLVLAAGARAATAVFIPTGQQITPTAASGSVFIDLNPGLSDQPAFTAGQAVTSLLSPDGKTLLILTSGYNRIADVAGQNIAGDSQEYVFVFDVSKSMPVQKQAVKVPNTFSGLVFAPDGNRFYASGGVDDNIHVYSAKGGLWAEDGAPIALGHGPGNGLTQGVPGVAGPSVGPHAAGTDLTADGKWLVVANYENDSISLVDVAARKRTADLDLRPGKIDPARSGVPGGEFPYWVRVKGNSTAYVSSLRDREVVVVDLSGPRVVKRIAIEGNPNKTITPNFHALASSFVNLDNFYCSGEVSMDGWQWSTAARSADANEKTTSVNYAGRGASYDSEGTARDINMALPTSAARNAANPINPLDPDLLPGTANEVELDGPDGEPGAGYIWNAALRAGKTVRNYGFFLDLVRLFAPAAFGGLPPVRDPFAIGLRVAYPAHPSLSEVTDPYFRGFDNKLPDFWRYREWAREFDRYVADGDLPELSLVRLMNDHMGSFSQAIDGVNTPETQQADNDYAVGLLVQKVARSPYAKDTLIFVLEDDAQDGPDHVDAHRSTAYVVGPYVKQGALVSTRYATVNMLRTIEDVLGLEHLSLQDRGVRPMTDVFDLTKASWTFQATPSDYLLGTTLPLPPAGAGMASRALTPTHDAAWWAEKTKEFDFSKEDRIDAARFNRVLWEGLMGDRPYPARRTASSTAAK